MRDNLERTNIVLPKDLKKQLKKHARKTHGSLSQFLRMAAINEVNGNRHQNVREIDLRPILKWMEETEDRIRQIENRLHKVGKGIDFLVGRSGDEVEVVADNIEELLLDRGEPMGVADVADYLPYSESEIVKGVEKLEDEFAVERVSGNGSIRWKLRGIDQNG